MIAPAFFLAGVSNHDLDNRQRIKIASISLWAYYPDGGWDFAVIYRSGNYAASYYVPPERGKEEAKGCDGVIVPGVKTDEKKNDEEVWTIGDGVYQHSETDRVPTEIAKELKFETKDKEPKLLGKAYIVINVVEGERRVYERLIDGKFKDAMIQRLNDTLISQVAACKK